MTRSPRTRSRTPEYLLEGYTNGELLPKLPDTLRTHSLRDIFDAIFYALRSMSGLWHRIFTILRTVETIRSSHRFDEFRLRFLTRPNFQYYFRIAD